MNMDEERVTEAWVPSRRDCSNPPASSRVDLMSSTPGASASDHDALRLRVMGVDDHPIVMEGVAPALGRRMPKFEWLGAASTYPALEQLIDEQDSPPHIVLVDLHVSLDSDPCDLITRLDGREIACVVFTSELRPVPIRRAVAAGARGVALKTDPVDALVDVITDVSRGNFAASGELAYALLSDDDLVAHLAPRELQVLELLAEGVPRKAIGRRLTPPVGTATVITYVNRICARYRRMGRPVGTIGDAIRAATEDGYLG